MSRARTLTAALAVAAVALAGCTATTATTAGQAQPSEELSASAAAPTAAAPAWVSMPERPVPPSELQLDRFAIQSGAAPYPGNRVSQLLPDGGSTGCTLGPLVRHRDGSRGFVTAGHCDKIIGAEVVTHTVEGERVPLGRYTRTVLVDNRDLDLDATVLWTTMPPAHGATTIAGRWPVAGVMPVDEVRALPVGTSVCVNAAVTGVTCTDLISAAHDEIRFLEVTAERDSGAAVFVVDEDSRATVIGLLSAAADIPGVDRATFAAPALEKLHAEIVTGE